MGHRHDLVIEKSNQSRRTLPKRFKEYALLVSQLLDDGFLDEISRRLRIYRRGGYAAVDAVLFLLGYFCSGCHEGLKGFDEDAKPYRSRMAVLGGRRGFPTQAAMSRLLTSIEVPLRCHPNRETRRKQAGPRHGGCCILGVP